MSRPFTEARPFYSSLFEPEIGSINLFEDETADPAADEDEELTVPDIYCEAADALRKNELWENIREHVVMEVSIGAACLSYSAHTMFCTMRRRAEQP
jgi:hypothetical protein